MKEKKDIQCYEKCMEKYPEKIKEIGLMYCELLANFTAHNCELTLPIKYIKEYIETRKIQCKGASEKMKNIAIELVERGLEDADIELIKKSSSQHLQVAFYYLKNNGFIEFTGRSTYRLIVPTITVQQLKNEVKSLKEVIKTPKKEDEKVFVNVINNLVTTDKKDKEEEEKEVETVVVSKPTSIMDKIKNDIINPLKEKIKNTEKQLIETTTVTTNQREIINSQKARICELDTRIHILTNRIHELEEALTPSKLIIKAHEDTIRNLELEIKQLKGFNVLNLQEEKVNLEKTIKEKDEIIKEFSDLSEWLKEISKEI